MQAPIYTPQARKDLRYILQGSMRMFGQSQARRYADDIRSAGMELASGFRSGRQFDEEHPEHLRFRVGSHYLIYRLDEHRRIRILRLLHVRMNIAAHL